MLLQDRHRWVHLQHAHILVVLGDIASPIALGKLYRTDQVRQVANERVGREWYPATCDGQIVTFSQQFTT